MNNTNPQSEVKHCEKCWSEGNPALDGVNNRPYCLWVECPCHDLVHPKESPVSQTVEWNSNTFPNREDITRNLGAVSQTVEAKEKFLIACNIKGKIGEMMLNELLSTLVKEMEKLETKADSYEGTDGAFAFKQCISAAVEVIKKMGV